MTELLVYFLVLLAYLPGIWLLKDSNGLQLAPLLLFAFLGMFFFNALGSILVMMRHYNYFGPLLTPQYVTMLVTQVFLFYVVVIPYLRWKKKHQSVAAPRVNVRGLDAIFSIALGGVVVLILLLYVREAGGFLIADLLTGKLNADTVLEYRARTYGLTDFRYYRLGFLVLPAMLGAHLVLTSMNYGRLGFARAIGLLLCFLPPLLMAEKAGVLYLALVLFAAWIVGSRASGRNIATLFSWRWLLPMALVALPTAVIYSMYYAGNDDVLFEVPHLLLFRTFGSYTESMAAALPFAQESGWLHGRSLPNPGGVFPWDRVNIEAALHHYMTHWEITFEFAGLAGSSSLPAVAEGYINFGWSGFIGIALLWFSILVVSQEILDRLRPQPVAQMLTAWYAYLALSTSLTGIFATLVSFIHTAVALAVYLLYLAILWMLSLYFGIRKNTQ